VALKNENTQNRRCTIVVSPPWKLNELNVFLSWELERPKEATYLGLWGLSRGSVTEARYLASNGVIKGAVVAAVAVIEDCYMESYYIEKFFMTA